MYPTVLVVNDGGNHLSAASIMHAQRKHANKSPRRLLVIVATTPYIEVAGGQKRVQKMRIMFGLR